MYLSVFERRVSLTGVRGREVKIERRQTLRTRLLVLTDKSRPRGDFIPAEALVQNGTAGDNGNVGGTLKKSTRFSGRMKPPLGGISSGSLRGQRDSDDTRTEQMYNSAYSASYHAAVASMSRSSSPQASPQLYPQTSPQLYPQGGVRPPRPPPANISPATQKDPFLA